MNIFRCTFHCILLGLFSLMLCSSASAHKIWLNPADHFPEPGSTVEIGIGWGHKYLADRTHEELKKGMPEKIQALDPDGETVELTKIADDRYSLKVLKPGFYLINVKNKSGFFTKTPEGRKWGNKTEIGDAVQCTNYHLGGKTVIMVGDSEEGFDRPVGQALEIVPLNNPGHLKKGDTLKVRLLLNGNPAAYIPIKAAYAGFEKVEKEEPAHPDKKKKDDRPFPAEAITDVQGEAELRLDHSGYWMISLSYKPPYPDSAVCDQYMYNMTFTFQVQ